MTAAAANLPRRRNINALDGRDSMVFLALPEKERPSCEGRSARQGLFLGFGMFGTVGTLSPPCPWNSPSCAGARNGNLSRYALSLTSTPGAKPAAASPATIRLIRTLLTFT